MSLKILKFGGSSVATIPRLKRVASIIKEFFDQGDKLVVVVSAMQGMTNKLVDLVGAFSGSSCSRESDVVISSGEQISSGLLALSLLEFGLPSKSFQGWQVPIITSSVPGEACIEEIPTDKLTKSLDRGEVPIVSGFQGISRGNEITTLGRGGSDISAVALSHFLNADECLIYTDVDGVYTADPRIVLEAKKLPQVAYEEMIEMSSRGAKVLQHRSVLISRAHKVRLRVLSSFNDTSEGTIIHDSTKYLSKKNKIVGITHDSSMFLIENSSEIVSFLTNKNIDFLEIQNEFLAVKKAHLGDVKQLNKPIDSDTGLISIVGQDISSLSNEISKELKTHTIEIKYQHLAELSLTLITPLQQTESAVSLLHNLLF